MVSAAVISKVLLSNHHQQDLPKRVTLAVNNEKILNNEKELIIDHLRIAAARASVGGSTRRSTLKRAQSMKSALKSSPSKDVIITPRSASSNSPTIKRNNQKNKKKKKGFFEFGPLRFISPPKDEGKRLRPTTLQRQDTIGIQKPGLRAMLYGLTLKMEKEEKMQKKLTRKREELLIY
ncbi:hypothetical protein Mgra_00001899 [Meloidogyne graminicola]|uniref:Uncharacterized protein n=1 Tax=Meloidogyne graminicola TaxID=189291 RepID=A0A8S9ZZH1_9BILA|nr:hypothetical protein Mgra_00001899 [Meloidogyne graminicola]